MSLQSWLNEFYPVPANKRAATKSDVDALRHSLLKWQGLTKENLNKHKVKLNNFVGRINDNQTFFSISSTTCALCERHESNCSTCPLNSHTCYNSDSPYRVWRDTGDPQPMIDFLEEQLRKHENIK